MGRLFDAVMKRYRPFPGRSLEYRCGNELAGVLSNKEDRIFALELLSPIVRRAGHHSVGWDTLGACFLDNGDLDVALACFARAHEQAPLNPTPLFHLSAPTGTFPSITRTLESRSTNSSRQMGLVMDGSLYLHSE